VIVVASGSVSSPTGVVSSTGSEFMPNFGYTDTDDTNT
jgi:hypothetical protein